jgi:glycerophosphoryl diester phosphodiesterase
MYQDLPRPTIFAHRGSIAHAPENTLAAFNLAVAQGAPAIELDAKLTADVEIVVFHDQTLERTTDGRGKLREQTLAGLKELDAGVHFSAAYKGEKIPTLTEVFETVGRLIFINVELTNYTSPRDQLPDKAAALVQKFGLEDRVMFSSFNRYALQRVSRLLPEVPRGLLALPGILGAPARSWLGRMGLAYQAIHPAERDATPGLIKKAHQRGYRVHVYTVNRRQEMLRLFQEGVDGIFTDDPPLAFDVLKQMGK